MVSGSAPAFEGKRDHARQSRRRLSLGGLPRRRRRFTRLHRDHAQDRVGARSKAWTSARYGTPCAFDGYRQGRLAHLTRDSAYAVSGQARGWIAPSSSPTISPSWRRDAAGQGARDRRYFESPTCRAGAAKSIANIDRGRDASSSPSAPSRARSSRSTANARGDPRKSRAHRLFFRCSFYLLKSPK